MESESETKHNPKIDGRKFKEKQSECLMLMNVKQDFEAKAETPSLKQEAFAALYDITQGDLSKWPKNSEAAADSVKRGFFELVIRRCQWQK